MSDLLSSGMKNDLFSEVIRDALERIVYWLAPVATPRRACVRILVRVPTGEERRLLDRVARRSRVHGFRS